MHVRTHTYTHARTHTQKTDILSVTAGGKYRQQTFVKKFRTEKKNEI